LSAASALADENWPQFRGPRGDGTSQAKGLPLTWSESEHVRWKTAIHDRGHSSPVVWEGHVWLTTATADGHRLFAVGVDRASGRILHDVQVFAVEHPQPIASLNSYASPTPVVEAGRVWVHFGTYGTACLDTATGKILWSRDDLHCDHFRGPGSSPILYRDLLILHYDGIDVQYLTALDKNTGKTVWKTDRSTDFAGADGDLRKAYSTPLLAEVDGRTLMLSAGAKAAMAYLPASGEEVWKVRYGGFSNTSRPLFGEGLAFLNTGFGKADLWAVRPDGRGDVTKTHVVWKLNKNVPTKPSILLAGPLIYMVDDRGIASCVDARTGEVLWHERIGGDYSSSPVWADGRIYVFDENGKSVVLAGGRQFKLLATNRLDAGCMASPAVVGGSLLVRTKTHLYCIENRRTPHAPREAQPTNPHAEREVY
jgi:outer membrane protein assembly factor BamB